MVQNVSVQFSQEGGPEVVTVGPVRRLPESELLEACPALRRLPGMSQSDAEVLLRENGFNVRATTAGWPSSYAVLHARRWGEPSPHSPCVMLICRVEDGRIASVSPATTGSHSARVFDAFAGVFPNRTAPAADQARAYAMIPVWTAGAVGLGALQFMFLPFSM